MTRDGAVALTAGDDGTARLWDLNSAPAIGETLLFSHDENLNLRYQPRASPDGRWLATLRVDGDGFVIHLIDLSAGFERRVLAMHHDWAAQDTFLHSLQFSRNGDKLYAIAGRDPNRRIAAWTFEAGAEPATEPINDVCAYRLLPDGVHAVVVHGLGSDRQISIWNLESDQIERTLVGGLPHVHQIELMADRSSVIVSSNWAFPRLVDLQTGAQTVFDMTISDRLNNAVPHPVENRVLLIRENRVARWFDPSSMEFLSFEFLPAEIYDSMAFGGDGRLLATSVTPGAEFETRTNRVALFDPDSNHKLYSLPTHGLSPSGVGWLPDGLSLAATLYPERPEHPHMIIWHLSDPDHNVRR